LYLGKQDFQLNALDAFINNTQLATSYHTEYKNYKELSNKYEELKRSNLELKKDEDYLKFQLNELNAVELEKNSIEQLKEREKFLSNASEIAEGINKCKALLDDNETNINQMVNEVQLTISKLSAYHSNLKSIADRLHSASIEIKDISTEIHHLSEEVEFNPNELVEIENKLNTYYSLQQKHQLQSVEELITLKTAFINKLNSIETVDEEIRIAELSLNKQYTNVSNLAAKLHKERTGYAKKLEKEVKSLLKQLGMNNAEFLIEVQLLSEFSSNGSDKVSFLFNANKGGKPQPLSHIASGGELSRLMLAIKSLINQRNVLPTVIFDEIDAGVSGEIAGKVGNILNKMAEKHQVLAITHLPQIASKAQFHFNVYKIEYSESTRTEIKLLDDHGRVEAIARMLSDEKVTETSVKAAQEMLS